MKKPCTQGNKILDTPLRSLTDFPLYSCDTTECVCQYTLKHVKPGGDTYQQLSQTGLQPGPRINVYYFQRHIIINVFFLNVGIKAIKMYGTCNTQCSTRKNISLNWWKSFFKLLIFIFQKIQNKLSNSVFVRVCMYI